MQCNETTDAARVSACAISRRAVDDRPCGRQEKVKLRWRQFWLSRGGSHFMGRMATRLGSLGFGPYRCLYPLAWIQPRQGYIAPSAEIIDVDLRRGSGVFIGERVVIARRAG